MIVNHYINYIYQMTHYLQYQQKKLEEMHQVVLKLQQDINDLKTKPQNVKNEYRFDLLKVESLQGTLNIGLTPNGNENSLGELAVNQSMDVAPTEQKHPELFQSVQGKIKHYLNTDAAQSLKSLEKQYGYPLDDQYREFIINDVKKQVDQRILYYLHQIPSDRLSPESMENMEQITTQKVIQDINQTFAAFLNHLPKKEEK